MGLVYLPILIYLLYIYGKLVRKYTVRPIDCLLPAEATYQAVSANFDWLNCPVGARIFRKTRVMEKRFPIFIGSMGLVYGIFSYIWV